MIRNRMALAICAGAVLVLGPGIAAGQVPQPPGTVSNGPGITVNPFHHRTGNPASGREVFRFETFGDEGFWTDAVRLPQGMMAARFNLLDALKLGLNVDADALPYWARVALYWELRSDLSPRRAPLIYDPNVMDALINANAIIGLVPRDTNGDGRLNIGSGDKLGVSCALCHSITDGSVFRPRSAAVGGIGSRLDGRASHSIDVGGLFALGANSRALYPNLQLKMPDGSTIGRAPRGLTRDSTEAEVDAYFRNKDYYPRGLFDDSPDGIGNAIQNVPFFRTDLSAPYGTAGEHAVLDDFSNAVYTVLLDMTTLATPGGRAFLNIRAGAAGDALANDYAVVLAETGVTGFPYIRATSGHKPGDPATPVGLRVDDQKLFDMNAYSDSLQAPRGAPVNVAAARRGRELFRRNCTGCHNVDQSIFVPPFLVAPKVIFPAYNPAILALRMPPQDPVQNSPGIFDDKYVVVDSSDRGVPRGNALPLLLDLARKPRFLHDGSVPGLGSLVDPARGPAAPHPFYLPSERQRADIVAFLQILDTHD